MHTYISLHAYREASCIRHVLMPLLMSVGEGHVCLEEDARARMWEGQPWILEQLFPVFRSSEEAAAVHLKHPLPPPHQLLDKHNTVKGTAAWHYSANNRAMFHQGKVSRKAQLTNHLTCGFISPARWKSMSKKVREILYRSHPSTSCPLTRLLYEPTNT